VSTHIGQGIAKRLGEVYSAPDRDELARRAARREADERESRIEALTATEERERRILALAAGWQAAVRTYRSLGGVQALTGIAWLPEPDPDVDPFEGLS
jgi:hypothetical protein